jgi:hypothetical protein
LRRKKRRARPARYPEHGTGPELAGGAGLRRGGWSACCTVWRLPSRSGLLVLLARDRFWPLCLSVFLVVLRRHGHQLWAAIIDD